MLVDSSLSVIIPAYQAEKTIARAIKSVLTIDVDSLEVIVVNDGSTDSTSEMVRSIVSFDKRVNLIEQSNSGGPSRVMLDFAPQPVIGLCLLMRMIFFCRMCLLPFNKA